MAAPNQEENAKRFRLDDLLNSLRSKQPDTSDDESEDTKGNNDSPSMFCKNCLHPYNGQEKSGSLVLRCEKCGHRDIVPQEEAASLNVEEWVGNLMMNRFLQVLKEQEDLCINITDPEYADDDYKRLTHALNEYCTYMNFIAIRIYDIAKESCVVDEQTKVTEEVDTCSSVDVVADITKLKEYCFTPDNSTTQPQSGLSTEPQPGLSTEPQPGLSTEPQPGQSTEPQPGLSTDQQPSEAVSGKGEPDNNGETPEITKLSMHIVVSDLAREEMKNIGSTVMKVMKALIAKHGLSPEIWDAVEEKMRNAKDEDIGKMWEVEDKSGATGQTDENISDESSGACGSDKVLSNKRPESEAATLSTPEPATSCHGDVVQSSIPDVDGVKAPVMEDQKMEKKTSSADPNVSDPVVATEAEVKDVATEAEVKDVATEAKVKFVATEAEVKAESEADSCDSAFDINTDVIEKEVFGALKSKLQLTNGEYDEDAFEIDFTKDYSSVLQVTQNIDVDMSRFKRRDTEGSKLVDGQDAGASSPSNTCEGEQDDEAATEGIEINFCTASTIFMSELQTRKREALLVRKEKALAVVNEKVQALKDEMERVENEVRDELHVAYETKVKKVENQRRQLTTRHRHVRDIEQLLTHYMETGQIDKLNELMEELDIQYDN